METVKVSLTSEEYEALAALCEQELRPLPDQLRYLLRDELGRRGLLQSTATKWMRIRREGE